MFFKIFQISGPAIKSAVLLNVFSRFLKLALFLGCIKVAITSTQNVTKLPFQLGVLILIFIAYSIIVRFRVKSQTSSSKFKALCRLNKLGYSGDFTKLHLSCISYFSSFGMSIFFGLTILLISGDLRYPLVISMLVSILFFYFLIDRTTNETLAFFGFAVLIAMSYFTSTTITQDIEIMVNAAIIFFIYRYFLFETLKMMRGYPRIIELIDTLK